MSSFPWWLRVTAAALISIPLTLLCVPVALMLLISLMLSADRRDWILAVLDRLVAWVAAMFGDPPTSEDGGSEDETAGTS